MATALLGWLLLVAALVTGLLHVAYLAVYDNFITVPELVEAIGSLHPKIGEHGQLLAEWYSHLPQSDEYYAATKLAPMVLLVLYSLLRCGWVHTLGLLASAAGDYALVWPENMKMFRAGTISFGIAHIFFIFSVGMKPIKPLLLLPFLAISGAQYYNLTHGLPSEILAHTGLVQRNTFLPPNLAPLVGIYTLIFAVHGWRATARLADTKSFGALVYLVGIFSFMVSDAILSTHHFIAPIKSFQVPVIITYFGGQWLMTAGAPCPAVTSPHTQLVSIPENEQIFFWIETVIIIFFCIEFIARLFCCPSLLKFVTSPMNWIDFLSIVPYFIMLPSEMSAENEASTTVEGLQVLRILRLLRIIRILKMAKGSRMVRIFMRALMNAKEGIYFLCFLILLGMSLSGTAMFYLETWDCVLNENNEWVYTHGLANGEVSSFQNIPVSMWWVLVTLTTVGYGDMYPVTWQGKGVAMFTMVAALICLAYPITLLGQAFTDAGDQLIQEEEERKRNVISCASVQHLNLEETPSNRQAGSVANTRIERQQIPKSQSNASASCASSLPPSSSIHEVASYSRSAGGYMMTSPGADRANFKVSQAVLARLEGDIQRTEATLMGLKVLYAELKGDIGMMDAESNI